MATVTSVASYEPAKLTDISFTIKLNKDEAAAVAGALASKPYGGITQDLYDEIVDVFDDYGVILRDDSTYKRFYNNG